MKGEGAGSVAGGGTLARLSGWGGYPSCEARVFAPRSVEELAGELARRLEEARPAGSAAASGALIVRGLGRSYGDSALAESVLQTGFLDRFLAFDRETGVLECEAGVSLRAALQLVVPAGWILPVLPGSGYVSVGGAVAADVHGKNHHRAGSFSAHVESLRLLLGSGEIVEASPRERADLFHATCGGMGLTGIVLSARLRLAPLRSGRIRRTTLRASCLEELDALFQEHAGAEYSVAWVDCLARGAALGRSVLFLGRQLDDGRDLAFARREPLAVPLRAPGFALNRLSVGAFNRAYRARHRHGHEDDVPLAAFFHPLDGIGRWNRLYGQEGFVQHNFAVPLAGGLDCLRAALGEIAAAGCGSFLSVVKRFGPGAPGPLSFPMEGYTLALDFKRTPAALALLRRLDARVAEAGGRVYLAKDALVSQEHFRAGYPRWREFEAVREKYGAVGRFASLQSRRLGLQ